MPEIARRGRLLEGGRARLEGELVLFGGGVLGERSAGDAEHVVAGGEAADVGSDGDHAAGDVEALDRLLRLRQSEPGEPDQVGGAGHQVPHASIDAGRAYVDQDLVVGNGRHVDAVQLELVGRTVCALHDRSHRGRVVGGRCSPGGGLVRRFHGFFLA